MSAVVRSSTGMLRFLPPVQCTLAVSNICTMLAATGALQFLTKHKFKVLLCITVLQLVVAFLDQGVAADKRRRQGLGASTSNGRGSLKLAVHIIRSRKLIFSKAFPELMPWL